MFLKNYTSEQTVATSIANIEKVLLRCGVKSIEKEYSAKEAGRILALVFRIAVKKGGPLVTIRLPADEGAATDALWIDYAGKLDSWDQTRSADCRKRKRRKDFIQQGERTAWRLMQDWIEVQMSMIQLQQAELMQVFLPYCWDGERTFFQSVKDHNYAGLLPAPSDPKTSGCTVL